MNLRVEPRVTKAKHQRIVCETVDCLGPLSVGGGGGGGSGGEEWGVEGAVGGLEKGAGDWGGGEGLKGARREHVCL